MTLWIPILVLVWSPILLYLVPILLRRGGLLRSNFRGETIPTGYGLFILAWLIPAYALWGIGSSDLRIAYAFLLTAIGFGNLGLLDDKYGTREFSGLKGHLTALLGHGKLTTGFFKAASGVGFGFFASYFVGVRDAAELALCTFIIALMANAFNILDLRPGRAGAVYLLSACITIASAPGRAVGLALSLIPALIVYVQDARGKVMLGDAGSNLLGGLLGLGVVLAVDSLFGRVIILVCLVALHVLAERVSITRVIEQNPILRRLDGLTGVR